MAAYRERRAGNFLFPARIAAVPHFLCRQIVLKRIYPIRFSRRVLLFLPQKPFQILSVRPNNFFYLLAVVLSEAERREEEWACRDCEHRLERRLFSSVPLLHLLGEPFEERFEHQHVA